MQQRLLFLFLGLSIVTALSSFSSLYAEYDLSGKILHDSRVLTGRGIYEDNSKGEFTKSISRVELKLERTDESGFGLLGELWATYDHLDSHLEQYNGSVDEEKRIDYDEFYIREAYASAGFGPAEFRIGKMLLNWGRTDEINFIDLINPEDLSEFYSIDKQERKIPTLLLDGLLYIGSFTLEAVWLPFFEPARVPSSGPWAQRSLLEAKKFFALMGGDFNELDFSAKDDEGRRDIINSETAIRFSGMLSSFDFGLVFFYGYNDLPALKTDVNDLGQPAPIVTYRRFHGYGLDFTYSVSGYGFRGEALYRDKVLYPLQADICGLNNHTSPDIQSILGIDRTFGENFYINIQLIYTRILDYAKGIIADEDVFMGMGTVEDKLFDDELKLGLDFYYGFNKRDSQLTPYAEYSLTDNLKAELGVFLICGPDDSDIGQFDENDMVYLRVSYAF